MNAPAILGWCGPGGSFGADPPRDISLPGFDSKEQAYQHLEATKAYCDSVNEDVFRNIRIPGDPKKDKAPLDIKENRAHRDYVDAWQSLYKAFGEYYRQTYKDGISYLDVKNVEAKTTEYHNKAREYHDRLKKLIGEANVTTPVPPEEKPPPGPGIDMPSVTGLGGTLVLGALAVGTVVVIMSLRK